MRTKMLCAVLAGIGIVGLLSGCGGLGEKKPEITLTLKTPVYALDSLADGTEKDMYGFLMRAGEAFAEQYEDADITVKVVQFENNKEMDEVTGCYGTENAVDVLDSGFFNMSSYIYDGTVVPLDDIITDAIRSDIPDAYWESGQVEGRTYMMPFLSSMNTLCYNKKLMREAGLDSYISDRDEIQSWTEEEWEEVLSTLKEKLPDTVYPMMMYAGDRNGDMHIMTFFRSKGSSFYDENMRFHLNTKEGIAAMEMLRGWKEAGYFPPNCDSMVMMDNYDLFVNNQLVFYVSNPALYAVFRDSGLDELGYVNFPSLDGGGYCTDNLIGFTVFDNGDEDRLAAAKAFVKYVYETDWLDYSTGGITCSRRVAEKYREQAEARGMTKYVENTSHSVNYTGNNPNWNGVREVFYPHIQDLLYGEMDLRTIAEEIDEDCNAAIEAGYENTVLHP